MTRKLESKLKRYAASSTGSKLPPEVQAVYDDARHRAGALPTDAEAIASALRQQVPPQYRENLVRLVYFTASCAQGMDPIAAIRYAGKMWAQTPAVGDENQPLAS
ncbi:MAG: hypothetical protein M3Z28_05935 [Candidatus Dormibacteraeota bacterium]|nr:hypothetical protein [Candidatus Dormibacteraeota bacterium]